MYLEVTRPHRVRFVSTLAITMLLAIGCSQPVPQPKTAKAHPPAEVVEVELPSAILPDGFVVDLELAVTPQEVADGLMYRPSLRENRGMLFVFEEERYPSFWMKNTLISLDMVFLSSNGTVVHIAANVPPCAADPCPTYSSENPARAVLEMVAGAAASHGVDAGTVIEFERVPGYPVAGDDPIEDNPL